MLVTIKQFFASHMNVAESSSPQRQQQAISLATAALLFEVSRADFQMDEQEQSSIAAALKKQFDLCEKDLNELLNLARSEVEASISMHQFTALVNETYDYPQKLLLIESMWQVAFSDGELDKYEDYLIRKVADLIYVSHTDFIQRKLKVQFQVDSFS
ncbi:MAG: TerB family tellurite resistance protein [Motiliproteus sp.]